MARALLTSAAALGLLLAPALSRAAEAEPVQLPAVLHLSEALELFRTRGLDLLLADAAVLSAEGDVAAAGAIPNPALSASAGKSLGCQSDACRQLAFSVGVSDQSAIEDSLSGKRGLRLRVARVGREIARLSRADAERTVGFQVKSAFVQVLLAQRALAFARETAAASAHMLELQQVREQAGAISEADLARVETAKLETDQAVDQAAGTLRTARANLAFLVGVRAAVPDIEAREPSLDRGAPLPKLEGATSDALVDAARAHRPDVQSAAKGSEKAEANLALQKRLRFPDLSLSATYAQQGTGDTAITPPTLTFGVAAPIPLLYRQEGEIRKAEADVRTQDLSGRKLDAQVRSDVESGLAGYRSARALVDRMEGRLLDRARRARDLVQIQYQKGAASLLDYLDAERTFIATQVEYLNDLTALWTSVFQLEQAVGTELRP
ncbi:MAG TPA: TolC family protein [Anaeromyxobacteraceae bacterium]|jgi:cobalt-zinc-cadmium efflux system outer membrane protein|nr:TolC family protein [Anaeromyxobacteraceae bacterium]